MLVLFIYLNFNEIQKFNITLQVIIIIYHLNHFPQYLIIYFKINYKFHKKKHFIFYLI